jgi:hypothetical protein
MNTDSRNWAIGLFLASVYFLYHNRKQLRVVQWGDVVNQYGYTSEKHQEYFDQEKRRQLSQKKLVYLVFSVTLLASAISWFMYQDEKSNYRYAQQAYYDGQIDGYSESCRQLFDSYSVDDILYAYGESYSYTWCKSLFELSSLGEEYPPQIDYEYSEEPDVHYRLGYYGAAFQMPKIVFSEVPFLCYGNKCTNVASFYPSSKINPKLPNAIKYGAVN